ncbi:MAG: phytanoyl-CoA dioxygenase family protein [Bdellovibrionales bacterium]|nr:phytanoyl-CoA dioxygenase family protein [Bdellovibrionales bacterium]
MKQESPDQDGNSRRLFSDGLVLLDRIIPKSETTAMRSALLGALEAETSSESDSIYHSDESQGTLYFRSKDGRRRVFWNDYRKAPECIRTFWMHPDLLSLVSHYVGVRAVPSKILGEWATAAGDTFGEWPDNTWHIDTICDQVKVMLLLQDTSERNGPMKFLRGSHRVDAMIRNVVVETFRSGYSKAYPGDSWVDGLEQMPVHCVGTEGTCVVFDTLCLHSASRCEEGERMALVAYFDTLPTRKNRALYRISKNFGHSI